MIILEFEGGRDPAVTGPDRMPDAHLVLVFGMGMIGYAIVDSLLRLGFRRRTEIAWSWNDAEARVAAVDVIQTACHHLLQGREPRLSVLWSAGKAGFHSTAADLAPENAAFSDTLDAIERLRRATRVTSLDIHYISSAGGLFEGQEVIDLSSRPTPLRPYGEMKWRQEALLTQRFPDDDIAIYRPSSVYGPYFRGSRHGLINHLVANGRRARVTVLDAHVMALRDYVFTGDIGRFVARHIRFGLASGVPGPEHFLVSGRCASIFEVVHKIERVLRLKIPYRLDEEFGNHRNITFNERVLPAGWRPSSLEVGIRQFLVQRAA